MPSRRVKPSAKVEKKLSAALKRRRCLAAVHVRTVDAMVKRGKLKAVKLGRRNMITAKSVENLVAARVNSPSNKPGLTCALLRHWTGFV